MRYWLYEEKVSNQHIEKSTIIYSDTAVLAAQWEHHKVIAKAHGETPNKEKCIQDWVRTKKAVQVTAKLLERYIHEQ